MLFNIFLVVHVAACFFLIVVVLMQSSKGGGLSGAFGGGGGGEAMFGGREAATFLSRATTYLAVLFMVTSLSLAFLSAGRGGIEQESALRKAAQQRQRVGTIAPEEQKNIDEILGTMPETGQEDQMEEAQGEPGEPVE